MLAVAATLEDAEALHSDLATLLPDHAVLHFPEQEILPYDRKSPYKGIVGQQSRCCTACSRRACLVVTSPRAQVEAAAAGRDP